MQWDRPGAIPGPPGVRRRSSGIDGNHEADAVVTGSEIHGVVEPVDDADALPHDVGEAGHVDVVQLAFDVAGFHQGYVSVVIGVVGVIGKLAGCCEPFEQLLHDGLGGVVVGELVEVGQGRECDHGEYSPLVDGIDAAGKGRGRKRPSYKIPRTPQFTD